MSLRSEADQLSLKRQFLPLCGRCRIDVNEFVADYERGAFSLEGVELLL